MTSFTVINHEARIKMGLSWLEYGLADLIYNLSNNPNSEFAGWCYASKETLAKMLGTTKQTVHTILNKLERNNIVERNPVTKHLKITIDWYKESIIKSSKETLPTVKKLYSNGKETLPKGSKETLHNNNNINKYNNNIKEIYKEKKKFSSLKDITPEVIQEIADKYKAPIGFVQLKLEVLKNYCESKGRRYKNYKSALRNFVLNDMQKMIEKKNLYKKGGFVDASI